MEWPDRSVKVNAWDTEPRGTPGQSNLFSTAVLNRPSNKIMQMNATDFLLQRDDTLRLGLAGDRWFPNVRVLRHLLEARP